MALGVEALAGLASKQGAAAAVAVALSIALAGGFGYFVKTSADAARVQSQANAQAITALAVSVDAVGDLVLSSCMPDHAAVAKYEKAKRDANVKIANGKGVGP